MLNYLRRKLYNWLRQENHRQESVELKPLQIEIGQDRLLTSRPLNFSLYRANGGWIVETRNQQDFDQRQGLRVSTDGSALPKLHIVHEDQDLGEALGKIVFMENLQK